MTEKKTNLITNLLKNLMGKYKINVNNNKCLKIIVSDIIFH